MNESDLRAAGANFGLLVDQARLRGLERIKLFLDVVDTEANVVQTLSALGDEFSDRCVRTQGLEQFNMCIACVQFRYANALLFNRFNGKAIEPECILIEAQSLFEICNRDSYVIDSLRHGYGPKPEYFSKNWWNLLPTR
jgi:hypothetical protein